MRDGADGPDRVLLDPNRLNPEGTTALDWYHPSEDGRLLARDRARAGARQAKRAGGEQSLGALRPGSVIRTRRGGGRAVVLRHDGGRGNHKLLVLGADGTVLRLGPADFDVARAQRTQTEDAIL